MKADSTILRDEVYKPFHNFFKNNMGPSEEEIRGFLKLAFVVGRRQGSTEMAENYKKALQQEEAL